TYRDISVTLDGKAVELGDSEPFIMNGSTYLPLRAIGEALGLTVKWEGAASSVHLFSPEAYHQRVTEPLSLDREGEAVLETCDTVTYTYPGFELVSVRPGSGADQTDSVTYFDAEGRPVKAMHYGADGSVYAEESWVYEDGLLRRHVYDAAEGSENDSCTLYEYKNGRLSREKRFDGDTVPRVHSTDSSYTYDEKGNTIKLYVHYPPGSWDEYLYEYDGSGLLLREDFTAYDILGGGFSYRSTEYFYENGLLVRSEDSAGTVTEYFYEGERPVKSIRALYSGEYLITSFSRA
ncbi:MAG: copper amine oxidase N-terminal domain-containing protein, partial [Clostridia bacterium]|nr:copper amine oxidase N-terminal domain-containing protein [Clostridia bacterium]